MDISGIEGPRSHVTQLSVNLSI